MLASRPCAVFVHMTFPPKKKKKKKVTEQLLDAPNTRYISHPKKTQKQGILLQILLPRPLPRCGVSDPETWHTGAQGLAEACGRAWRDLSGAKQAVGLQGRQ